MLLLYAALLLIPFALNYLASRDDYARYVDGLFASGMLAAIWAFTNAVGVMWAFPANKVFHPLVDLIGLSVAVAAYMTQRQRWKLVLAYLFLCQMFAHAAFWWSWRYSPGAMSGRDYVGLLNMLWMVQLICVATPGGGHVAIRTLRRLHHARSLPDMARR